MLIERVNERHQALPKRFITTCYQPRLSPFTSPNAGKMLYDIPVLTIALACGRHLVNFSYMNLLAFPASTISSCTFWAHIALPQIFASFWPGFNTLGLCIYFSTRNDFISLLCSVNSCKGLNNQPVFCPWHHLSLAETVLGVFFSIILQHSHILYMSVSSPRCCGYLFYLLLACEFLKKSDHVLSDLV